MDSSSPLFSVVLAIFYHLYTCVHPPGAPWPITVQHVFLTHSLPPALVAHYVFLQMSLPSTTLSCQPIVFVARFYMCSSIICLCPLCVHVIVTIIFYLLYFAMHVFVGNQVYFVHLYRGVRGPHMYTTINSIFLIKTIKKNIYIYPIL
jgi:hypothetical protein